MGYLDRFGDREEEVSAGGDVEKVEAGSSLCVESKVKEGAAVRLAMRDSIKQPWAVVRRAFESLGQSDSGRCRQLAVETLFA